MAKIGAGTGSGLVGMAAFGLDGIFASVGVLTLPLRCPLVMTGFGGILARAGSLSPLSRAASSQSLWASARSFFSTFLTFFFGGGDFVVTSKVL